MKRERVEFGENPCLTRIEEKCKRCGNCVKTCESIHNMGDSCIRCGQCILTCPFGAIVPKYDYQKVLNYLNDTDYTVIVSIAPASRVSLIEELKTNNSDPTKHLVGVLRKLGFDYVYDIACGADVTTIEESMELIERIKEHKFPLMTSCCPSWKKYAKETGLDKYVSSTKSPIKMQGYMIKNYLSKYIDYGDKVINVILMPCVSKKEEILDSSDIDIVITTRELLYMIDEAKIDLNNITESDFDSLAGSASSAGIIFGTSGGVLESVIRTTYYLMNNKKLDSSNINKCLDNNNFYEECVYDLGKVKLNTCKVCGMKNVQKLDLSKYHLIEVMACPGGCINGGGQVLVPNNKLDEIRNKRSQDLVNIDIKSSFKNSYESKEVSDLYKYDIGMPGSGNANKKLHN
ncbi:MAG: 4Fe-4S binding protein [Bacilli bacterium]|nr:4Fe-4S binding protein [Bacilli bacterium]